MPSELVCYTHYDLKYFTVHNYRAEGFFEYLCGEPRRHAAIVHIEKGSAAFEQDGRVVRADEGDWVYLPMGIRYRTEWRGESISYFTLDFRFEKRLILQHVPNVSEVELTDEQPTLRITRFSGTSAALGHELEAVCRFFRAERASGNVLAAAAFYRLWHLVLCAFEEMPTDAEIARAVAEIEADPRRPIDLETLYRKTCMSKSTFFSRFRAATGTSPVQYRNRILARMGHALMESGEYTLTQVSDWLGLSSPDYLTVLMKKHLYR